jgi:hypothetical protein
VCVSNTCAGTGLFNVATVAGPNETVGNLACDLDADGFDDAIFVNQLAGSVSIYWGNAQAAFASATTLSTGRAGGAAACADFDNDGRPDLLVTRQDSHAFDVYPQTAARTFGAAVTTSGLSFPHGVATVDADGDGNVDALVRTGGTAMIGPSANPVWSYLRGRGDGSFDGAVAAFGAAGASHWFADLDGDGKVEVIGGAGAPYTISTVGAGGALTSVGTFAPAPCASLEAFTTADVNADGRGDLLLQCSGTLVAYISTGLYQFAPCTVGSMPSVCGMNGTTRCGAHAVFDYNHDGRADFMGSATCSFCSSRHFLGVGQ